jgi:hypothetical protein
MTWLFEQPLIIVVLGVAIIFGLGAVWSATGRKELLYAIGAAFLLLIVGLIVERRTITDREAIRMSLHRIAQDVKSNSRRAVLSHIHSSAPELKRKAEAELPNYKFDECRVTKIHLIDVDDQSEPQSAIAEFNIVASGTFSVPGIEATGSYPRWVKLHLLRENDGRWTVVDYEHDEPTRMMKESPEGKR